MKIKLLFALCLFPSLAFAQIGIDPVARGLAAGAIQKNALPGVGLLAAGGLQIRSVADFLGSDVDFASLGGKNDAFAWQDGTQAIGSTTITSNSLVVNACDAGGCTDAFGQAIPAKYICNTGALNGTALGPQGTLKTGCGLVVAVSPPHTVQTNFTAQNATPAYGISNIKIVNNEAYGATPGDIVTITGIATQVVAAQQKIIDTMVVSATVVAGGSGALGGASGQCMVIGTTGVLRKQKNITYVEVIVNVTSGSMTSVASIYNAGDYTTNPNNSTPSNVVAEPVVAAPNINGQTPCTGLTGGTLSLYMGVLLTSVNPLNGFQRNGLKPYLYGNYTSVAAGTYNTTGNGNEDNSLTLNVSGDFQVAGSITEYTDNTAAYNTAVGLINTARSLGVAVNLHISGGQCSTASATSCAESRTGAFGFGNSAGTATIGLLKGGGIVGDGKDISKFYFSPLYPAKPMIWADGYGLALGTTFDGPTTAFSLLAEQTFRNFEIFSDTTGSATIALGLCGSSYFGQYQNIDIRQAPNEGFAFGCLGPTDVSSHNRESRIENVRVFNSGSTGNGAFVIETDSNGTAGAAMDDVGVHNLEIFGNHGPGIVVHATHGVGNIGFVNFTGRIRVEGLAPDGYGLQGDLIQVGDSNTSYDGCIHDVHFPGGMQLIDPYQGFFAFHTETSSSGCVPYDITIEGEGLTISGGAPLGGGIAADYCSLCTFHIAYSGALGYDYQQGPLTQTGNLPVKIDFGLNQAANYAVNMDPTAQVALPAYSICTGAINCSTTAAIAGVATSYLSTFTVTPVTPGDWSVVFDPSSNAWTWSNGNETCFDFYAKFTPTFTTATGYLEFTLPVKPSLYAQRSFQLNNFSGITWPNSATGVQFSPQPNAYYGVVNFIKSATGIPSASLQVSDTPNSSAVVSGTQYIVATGGCYN
jgi:hypothetical protein